MKSLALAALLLAAPAALAQSGRGAAPPPEEEAVDPYVVSNANAGTTPFLGPEMLNAFHGNAGIARIVDDLVEAVRYDKRTEEVFHASDFQRLRRTLKEQFCYILNGGCDYTGRDMRQVHADHGVTLAEFNALVELLQDAMDREHVAFAAQNKLLAKLAPMRRDVVRR